MHNIIAEKIEYKEAMLSFLNDNADYIFNMIIAFGEDTVNEIADRIGIKPRYVTLWKEENKEIKQKIAMYKEKNRKVKKELTYIIQSRKRTIFINKMVLDGYSAEYIAKEIGISVESIMCYINSPHYVNYITPLNVDDIVNSISKLLKKGTDLPSICKTLKLDLAYLLLIMNQYGLNVNSFKENCELYLEKNRKKIEHLMFMGESITEIHQKFNNKNQITKKFLMAWLEKNNIDNPTIFQFLDSYKDDIIKFIYDENYSVGDLMMLYQNVSKEDILTWLSFHNLELPNYDSKLLDNDKDYIIKYSKNMSKELLYKQYQIKGVSFDNFCKWIEENKIETKKSYL